MAVDPKLIELARACRDAQKAALSKRGRDAGGGMDPAKKSASVRAEDALLLGCNEYLAGHKLSGEAATVELAETAVAMVTKQRQFWRGRDQAAGSEARDYERRLDRMVAGILTPSAPGLFSDGASDA